MRKTKGVKQKLGFILAFFLIMQNYTTSLAVDVSSDIGKEYQEYYINVLRNTYISTCSASVSISGGVATCTGVGTKYANQEGDITLHIYLQKQIDGNWSNVDSKNDSYSSNYGTIVLKTNNLSSGTYRAKVSAWVKGENVIVYSSIRTI